MLSSPKNTFENRMTDSFDKNCPFLLATLFYSSYIGGEWLSWRVFDLTSCCEDLEVVRESCNNIVTNKSIDRVNEEVILKNDLGKFYKCL